MKMVGFETKDYPGLYQAANQYSLNGQKIYTRWFRIELFFLLGGAILGSVQLDDSDLSKYISGIAALIFVLGLSVNLFITLYKVEERWYIGRAIAESIKSMTWRYITRGEPYEDEETLASRKFPDALREILNENKQFIAEGFLTATDTAPITPKMQDVRKSSVDQRLKFYVSNRVCEQLKWYKDKAQLNSSKHLLFFNSSNLLYVFAIGYHIYLIINPQAFNLAPIFATAVGCAISWSKMKQYRELAQSYAVTANEIELIRHQAHFIESEKELQGFIGDAETAFSREHTLWLARRDILK